MIYIVINNCQVNNMKRPRLSKRTNPPSCPRRCQPTKSPSTAQPPPYQQKRSGAIALSLMRVPALPSIRFFRRSRARPDEIARAKSPGESPSQIAAAKFPRRQARGLQNDPPPPVKSAGKTRGRGATSCRGKKPA